jgi:cellobiose epimerase
MKYIPYLWTLVVAFLLASSVPPKKYPSDKTFLQEVEDELDNILNYWQTKMVDQTQGGFYGKIDAQNQLIENAPKAIILNTRILWTFSAAYNYSKKETHLQTAHRAYQYLSKYFMDKEFGGVYWGVDYQGNPTETDKQVYAQSFAIYALSEYYLATQNEEAKKEAIRLFELVEKHSFDAQKGGYLESFERDWKVSQSISRLGATPSKQRKNMNTHLHLLEAYTTLYKIYPSADLAKQLTHLVTLFQTKFLDKKTGHFWAFFDEDWKLTSETYSYGHDIEASWLLSRATEVLKNKKLHSKIEKLAVRVVDVTLQEGMDKDAGIVNTGKSQKITDWDKHWWPQAEAMVGLVNAYQITQNQMYLQKNEKVWNFTKKFMIDKENGEWFFRVNQQGQPYMLEDKAGAWKCPYHNSRALMEVLMRLKK